VRNAPGGRASRRADTGTEAWREPLPPEFRPFFRDAVLKSRDDQGGVWNRDAAEDRQGPRTRGAAGSQARGEQPDPASIWQVWGRLDALVPCPNPDDNVTVSPGDSNSREEIRNEPNTPAGAVIEEIRLRPDEDGQRAEASSIGGGGAGLASSIEFGNGGPHRIFLPEPW